MEIESKVPNECCDKSHFDIFLWLLISKSCELVTTVTVNIYELSEAMTNTDEYRWTAKEPKAQCNTHWRGLLKQLSRMFMATQYVPHINVH